MKFVTFIENRFQELTLEGKDMEYSVYRDAQTKALHNLLNAYRALLKWLYLPKCLFDYFWTNLGFFEEPQPVLIQKLKADKEALEKQKALKEELEATCEKISPIKKFDARKLLIEEEKK